MRGTREEEDTEAEEAEAVQFLANFRKHLLFRATGQLRCILLTGACGVRKWAGPSRRRLTIFF